MKIGVIGIGMVGKAISRAFVELGYIVRKYDIKLPETNFEDTLDTDIIYICVPTKQNDDGSCDLTIVEETVFKIAQANYKGTVAIKSTVEPGTTLNLQNNHPDLELAHVPEFLRERCAITDFTENHDLLVIGTNSHIDFKFIKEAHGDLPQEVVQLSPNEAELAKYFNNCYNATLITFANAFSEACKIMGVNYSNVMNCVSKREHISKKYLQCNDSFKGFGGMCLPKDMRAVAHICKDSNVSFFSDILDHNNKFKMFK